MRASVVIQLCEDVDLANGKSEPEIEEISVFEKMTIELNLDEESFKSAFKSTIGIGLLQTYDNLIERLRNEIKKQVDDYSQELAAAAADSTPEPESRPTIDNNETPEEEKPAEGESE